MTRKILLFTTLCLLSTIVLFAQTDATGETALYKELEKADKELNLKYKQTLKKLSIDKRKTLLNEQRKWIKERDLKCKNDKEGGVYENKLRIDCLIQETTKRTKQLITWDIKKKK